MFLINPYSFGGGNLLASTSYVGNGAIRSIVTGQNLTAGGLVFGKDVGNGGDWLAYDTVRGVSKRLIPNADNAEISETSSQYFRSFDSTGFSLGVLSSMNSNGVAQIAFSWLEQSGYMNIVTYTGNGSAQTLNHNLADIPKLMIVKSRSNLADWYVYHSAIGANKMVLLNKTNAVSPSQSNYWDNTEPTSTHFTVGTPDNSGNTQQYIAYLFAEKAGTSKFGSYIGNGGSNAITGLGFTPKMVLIKQTNSDSNWTIGYKDSGTDFVLFANTSDARSNSGGVISLNSNGFTLGVSSTVNTSGGSYIYAAWG